MAKMPYTKGRDSAYKKAMPPMPDAPQCLASDSGGMVRMHGEIFLLYPSLKRKEARR